MDWFMEHIRMGYFEVKNPYRGLARTIEISTKSFHSIVFWSKNYGMLIDSNAGERLRDMGFHLYFNFTINSESPVLEPEILPIDQRLEQLKTLSSVFGPENIAWRFDPVCLYRTEPDGPIENNLSGFMRIAQKASEFGITKCVTSFLDMYPKILKRLTAFSQKGFSAPVFIDPPLEKKLEILRQMHAYIAKLGMGLSLCCEKELYHAFNDCAATPFDNPPVKENACIDGTLLKKNFGGLPETARDYGQRSGKGCKCTRSIDIGSYTDHPCFHNCLFCYAAPEMDTRIKKGSRS